MLLPFRKAPEQPVEAPPPASTSELEERIQALTRQVDDLSEAIEAQATGFRQALDAHTDLVKDLAQDMDRFDEELADGLKRAKRHEDRVRAAIRRAEESVDGEFELSPAVQAEIAEHRREHEDERPPEGVQPVREALDLNRESSIPGVTVRQLLRAQGVDPSTLGGL